MKYRYKPVELLIILLIILVSGIGCDINENIIMMWKGLQNGWTPPKHITKEEYLELKNIANSVTILK